MDAIQALIVRHLKDPTTYAGIAAILITYLPSSVTGIDASQWQQAIAGIVGLALIWIDGRMKSAQATPAQKGFGSNVALTGVILLGIIGLALSGCAGMFSAANLPATVKSGCSLVGASNATFQTYAASHPGKIDANGMSVEGGIMDTVGLPVDGKSPIKPGSVCDPNAVPNLAIAETTLLTASLNLANLLSTWQK